jgi:hypothetical protein
MYIMYVFYVMHLLMVLKIVTMHGVHNTNTTCVIVIGHVLCRSKHVGLLKVCVVNSLSSYTVL